MTKNEIINAIIHDNNRQDIYNRVMPHVIDILKKYNGKPYGEKTKKKISEELKARCNCAMYLHGGYGEDLTIVPLTDKGFSDYRYSYRDFNIYVKYPNRNEKGATLTKDNKINGTLEYSDFYLSDCHEYIAEPEKHAEEIMLSFKALDERYEEFERCIRVYNSMLPSRVENRNVSGFRRYI